MKLPRDRFDYSPIAARPPWSLPKGARIAVWTIVNIEEWDIEKAMARKQPMPPLRDEEIPVFVALGRKIAEEWTGTERQKQNAKLWADAAKVTLNDPLRHNPKASAKQ